MTPRKEVKDLGTPDWLELLTTQLVPWHATDLLSVYQIEDQYSIPDGTMRGSAKRWGLRKFKVKTSVKFRRDEIESFLLGKSIPMRPDSWGGWAGRYVKPVTQGFALRRTPPAPLPRPSLEGFSFQELIDEVVRRAER